MLVDFRILMLCMACPDESSGRLTRIALVKVLPGWNRHGSRPLRWIASRLHRRYDDYAAFKAGVKELELMTATAMRTALSDAPGLRLQLEALAVSRI